MRYWNGYQWKDQVRQLTGADFSTYGENFRMTREEMLAEDRRIVMADPDRHVELFGTNGCFDKGCPICFEVSPSSDEEYGTALEGMNA